MKPLATTVAANAQGEVKARLSAYHGLDQLPERAAALALVCGRPVGGHDGSRFFGPSTATQSLQMPRWKPAPGPRSRLGFDPPWSRSNAVPSFSSGLLVRRLAAARCRRRGLTDARQRAGLRAARSPPSRPSQSRACRAVCAQRALEGECPEATAQAVLLTWEGGVSGPRGVTEAQRTAISVVLENGDRVHPLVLGDVDRDNHVVACMAEASPAVSVSVLFHDPGDDANPETRVEISKR